MKTRTERDTMGTIEVPYEILEKLKTTKQTLFP